MNQPVRLHFSELRVPLKMTFRQASAARTHGESLWVEAARGEHRGYGEGCPRSYVTGETRASCRQWLGTWQEAIQSECTSLDALRGWLAAHAGRQSTRRPRPGAPSSPRCSTCSRASAGKASRRCWVWPPPGGPHRYSAVLGNDEPWKTRFLIDQYCILGLTDFKVKLGGDLEVDRQKLRSIAELTALARRGRATACGSMPTTSGPTTPTARWTTCVRSTASSSASRSRSSRGTWTTTAGSASGSGVPIILDESLCTMADLRALRRAARALHRQPEGLAGGRRAARAEPRRGVCAAGAGRSSSARTSARPRC